MDLPRTTRYVTTVDAVSLACDITGDGPIDIIWLAAGAFPFDLLFDEPGFRHLAKRLGGFSRTLWASHRGLGPSGGRVLDVFDEAALDRDMTTFLDECECKDVVIVGPGMGGPAAIRYAAAHPERVSGLILIDTYAHYVREPDYPIGYSPQMLEQVASLATETWAVGAQLDSIAPSKSADAGFRERWARILRFGSPLDEVAESLRLSYSADVRSVLADLAMPTLVLHRTGDRSIRVDAGRYLGANIPGARYVELAGDDHLYFLGDVDALADEIEEFLTGARQAPEGDTVLATVVFTDIVSSTEQSARLGHRAWGRLTAEHDAMVRAALSRHRGREVKTLGDGFLATFDSTIRAVRAASEIVTAAEAIGVEVRAVVHTGEIEVRSDDVAGLNVTIAKRICDLAGPGQVLVSDAVRALIVDAEIPVSDHGTHVLKGVPNERRLFAVPSRPLM